MQSSSERGTAPENGSGARYDLNMLTLTFRDRGVEKHYARDTLSRSLPLVRISLFFAAVLYGFFGILDFLVIPEAHIQTWLIRFAFVCPILLAVTALTFKPGIFFSKAQPLLTLCMAASGFGIIAMTLVVPAPVNAQYYAGLIMVVIYGSTLVRLRFHNATIVSLALVVSYQPVAMHLNPVAAETLIANNFFLLMATLVGIFASYIQELYIRRNWISTELLTQEKERSENLLAESQAANHAKSEFLAIVSHELRTPLNAIIGFSEFLKMEMFGPLGSDRYRAYADDIYTSGQHLLQIINDILDLSRAEAKKLELSDEEFELDQVIDTCMRMFRTKAAEDGVRLSWRPGPSAILRADQRLITQVVINLLSNAIKFTGRGGEVVIWCEATDEEGCAIAVQDTGIGIASGDIPKIMEPFVQVESAISRHHEGLGLGLPLVKRIVERHGGEIAIDSTIGKGTKVTVRLPAARLSAWTRPAAAKPPAVGAAQ
jgi:two-component system cell cycle sensor histidine kinase PleC